MEVNINEWENKSPGYPSSYIIIIITIICNVISD